MTGILGEQPPGQPARIDGSIHAEPVPPRCRCCGDEFAEMIDIRELHSDTPEWFCKEIGPCMQRQALTEAAKNRRGATP